MKTFGLTIMLFVLGSSVAHAKQSHLVIVSRSGTLTLRLESAADINFRTTCFTDSNSAKLEQALLELLDADHDKRLSREELADAEGLLRTLDYDEDESLSPLEISPNLLTTGTDARPKQEAVVVYVPTPEEVEVLNRSLALFDRQDESPLDQVDVIIDFQHANDESVRVRSEPHSNASVKTVQQADGATRFLISKGSLWVDLWTGGKSSKALNIEARPGRRGLFELIDADANSKLSRGELRAAASSLNVEFLFGEKPEENEKTIAIQLGINSERRHNSITLLPHVVNASYDKSDPLVWFEAADQNRDGVLCINEFLAGDEQFIAFDFDGDGLISRAEAERASALAKSVR